jgi:hypothetical protein
VTFLPEGEIIQKRKEKEQKRGKIFFFPLLEQKNI